MAQNLGFHRLPPSPFSAEVFPDVPAPFPPLSIASETPSHQTSDISGQPLLLSLPSEAAPALQARWELLHTHTQQDLKRFSQSLASPSVGRAVFALLTFHPCLPLCCWSLSPVPCATCVTCATVPSSLGSAPRQDLGSAATGRTQHSLPECPVWMVWSWETGLCFSTPGIAQFCAFSHSS